MRICSNDRGYYLADLDIIITGQDIGNMRGLFENFILALSCVLSIDKVSQSAANTL